MAATKTFGRIRFLLGAGPSSIGLCPACVPMVGASTCVLMGAAKARAAPGIISAAASTAVR